MSDATAGSAEASVISAETGAVLAAGPVVTVRILELPVDVFAAAQQQNDELMREFALMADGLVSDDPDHASRPLPARLIAIVGAFSGSYGAFTGAPEDRLAAAVRDGEAVIDELVYEVPASAAAAATQLGALLDEADDYCRAGQHLLTLATPPELVAFRRWFLDEFEQQVAGRPPTPWPSYRAQNQEQNQAQDRA
ncbi:MAG: hypothetical protein ACXV4A_02105 [Actinomycetes bacterium]